MIKRIDIGGIERQLSVSNMADGSMYELRGMTHRGGNLRPQGGLVQVKILNKDEENMLLYEGDRLLYVHKYDDYEHFIVWRKNYDLYYITDGAMVHIEQEVRHISRVLSMGNMLIVTGADSSIKVWLWQNGQYTLVSESGLPYIGIRKSTIKTNADGSIEIYTAESDPIDIVPDKSLGNYSDIIGSSWPTYIKNKHFRMQLTEQYGGLISNLREKASAENVFVDSYFVRYGLRMYDGNYLHVSPPIYIKGSRYELLCNSAKFSTAADNTGGVWKIFQGCRAKADGYKLYADFRDIDSSLYVNGIVTAIDFFVSEPIREVYDGRQIDAVEKATQIGGDTNTEAFFEVRFDTMTERKIEDIESYFNYYRVWSVPVDSVQDNIVEIDAKNKLNSILQMPLLNNNASVHKYGAEAMYAYNGRLHIGNIREKLFDGYSPCYYTYIKDNGAPRNNNSIMYVYLRDGGGEYIVKSETSVVKGIFTPYISYPDSRAYKIVLLSSEDGVYSKRTFLLKEHPFANESYYFDGYDVEDVDIDSTTYHIELEEYNRFIADTHINDLVIRCDVVKVSELHNPMVFENAKTYTVGNGKIVAMASATKAMSTGQFGQYPLYVFASDGIYAMLSGGGDVLYSNVAPVNHHVVENARTVCPVDEAVVFGTRQGLFILAGGDTVNISTPLDEHGLPMIENGRNLENLVRNVCGEDIYGLMLRERIANGGVAYHYANREILLYDKSGDCKIYSIENKKWYSSAYDVSYAVASYPELYVVNDANVYTIKDIPSGDATSTLLLVTNPMQLSDAMNAKRAARIHLVSHLCGASDESFVDVGIGVSNDGEEYALAYRKELRVGKVHNLTIPHGMSGYRYMVIVIYGYGMDARSYINSIEVEFDEVRKER